jgi:lysophospholipid acyltransferase (LPLAT)-like uncharacterized protein
MVSSAQARTAPDRLERDLAKAHDTHSPSLSLQERCLGFVFKTVLQRLAATWRVDYDGLDVLDQLTRLPQRHILAFWHRHYITLFHLFHDRPIVAITNRSHRGQVIANICQRTGMPTLQVPAKGTKRMLDGLKSASESGFGLAIAVDGPLGPACEVKRVVLHLAARLQCPIVPVSVATRHKKVITRRWDHLEIPHLFSRVSFVIGTPIDVARTSSRPELRELGRQLKQAIEGGTSRARQRVGDL